MIKDYSCRWSNPVFYVVFHSSIVFVIIAISIAHILIVHAEVEARIAIEYSFGSAFFVFSAVFAMTFIYLSVDFHSLFPNLMINVS